MRHNRIHDLAVALVAASMLAACGGGDDAATTTTAAATTVASTAAPPTTAAPTTTGSPPSTTAAASSTTATATPTTSVDDLKAQIAADYVASQQRLAELEAAPTLDGLEARLATIAAPGSAYYEQLLSYLQELVQLGDVVIPNDPPVNSVTVELVTLDDAQTSATLTVCEVNNLKRVTPAENSAVGEEVLVGGGDLAAKRRQVTVALFGNGWLQTIDNQTVDALYPGRSECEPAQ